jgi:hypothetical protein
VAGEIDRALARYSERIEAAAPDFVDLQGDDALRAVRMSLLGFDLDFEEVESWIRKGLVAATIVGGAPVDFFVSGSIGGLAIGLLIAEEREKAGQT